MTTRNAASMNSFGSEWQAAGYCGSGNVAHLIGSLRTRTAVVCGSGEGVFDELNTVLSKVDDPVIFAANDIGMFLPELDHWCSLHSDYLGAWKSVRWLHPRPREHTKYHAIDDRPYVDYTWAQLTPLFVLSGYFAMQVAYLMGCEQIILCGCPGDKTRRFFDLKPREDFGYGSGVGDNGVREQVEKMMDVQPEFKSKVRSMSGWTREFFGGL